MPLNRYENKIDSEITAVVTHFDHGGIKGPTLMFNTKSIGFKEFGIVDAVRFLNEQTRKNNGSCAVSNNVVEGITKDFAGVILCTSDVFSTTMRNDSSSPRKTPVLFQMASTSQTKALTPLEIFKAKKQLTAKQAEEALHCIINKGEYYRILVQSAKAGHIVAIKDFFENTALGFIHLGLYNKPTLTLYNEIIKIFIENETFDELFHFISYHEFRGVIQKEHHLKTVANILLDFDNIVAFLRHIEEYVKKHPIGCQSRPDLLTKWIQLDIKTGKPKISSHENQNIIVKIAIVSKCIGALILENPDINKLFLTSLLNEIKSKWPPQGHPESKNCKSPDDEINSQLKLQIQRDVNNGVDYYAILGLSANCTTEQIKTSFRTIWRTTRQRDPMQTETSTKETLQKANQANEVLSAPEARKYYDTLMSASMQNRQHTKPRAK